jgi:hypothetical protein
MPRLLRGVKVSKRNRDAAEVSVFDKINSPFLFLDNHYGIQNLDVDYFNHSVVECSFSDWVKLGAEKYFGSSPSVLFFQPVKLNSFIKILKESGVVYHLMSNHTMGGLPIGCVLLLKIGDESIFISLGQIEYAPASEYSNISDDETFQGTILSCFDVSIIYKTSNTVVSQLVNNLKTITYLKHTKSASHIDMIATSPTGLFLRNVDLEHPGLYDLDLHYGEGFENYHNKLINRIASRSKGIVMFHGLPGTGKTYYIRSIIPKLVELGKRVVLIPKHVLESLESPDFNSFMVETFGDEQSVFIIEDAESIISKRDSNGGFRSAVVSTLLNITDGILNDIFNIQVILTFNTEINCIDEALLRKGRLISKYEFGPLDREDAKKLAKNIGVEINDNKTQYSLAEIYSLKESLDDDILINQNIKEKSKSFVGF